jgi:hypothetical protein
MRPSALTNSPVPPPGLTTAFISPVPSRRTMSAGFMNNPFDLRLSSFI